MPQRAAVPLLFAAALLLSGTAAMLSPGAASRAAP
eukprot:CAMPEP_0194265000 /NCGR_PEP_ID=MMETSP0169-20130528/358_1 /TAXON_ID=218684 /ORGANISM="Corethron pennatum, Strain L29A3" /LENGTH=34 /DNA_ID= /DNA_START= /DNA_END= /DNA_ORIENTATION=